MYKKVLMPLFYFKETQALRVNYGGVIVKIEALLLGTQMS